MKIEWIEQKSTGKVEKAIIIRAEDIKRVRTTSGKDHELIIDYMESINFTKTIITFKTKSAMKKQFKLINDEIENTEKMRYRGL